MKKNINRIAFLNILSVILLQGLSLISSPLFSRLLGTDGYGSLSSFSVWSSILSTIFSLQAGATIANARVEFPEEEQRAYQSSALTLSLLSFSALGAALFLLREPIADFLQIGQGLVLLMLLEAMGSFLVGFLSSKYTYEFQAEKNMALSVGMAVGTMVLSLLLVLRSDPEQRWMGRLLGNTLVYAAVGLTAAAVLLRRGRCFYNRRYWRFCLMLGVPLVFQNLSYQLLGNSDIMMLRQMTGSSEAGIYSLALTLAGILFTIFTALNGTWIPFFFDDMKEKDYETARSRAEHFMELFTVLAMGFVLLVREVYHVYAAEEYWPGTNLIPIFAAGYYINFLNTFPVTFETYHKKTSVVAGATIAAALINLGLNYVFIRLFGSVGAAAATAVSHGIQYTMHMVYSRTALKDSVNPLPLWSWVKYAAAFAAAVLLFYAASDLWLLRWIFGAGIGLWELLRIYRRRGLF